MVQRVAHDGSFIRIGNGSVLQGAATAQGDTPLLSPQSVQGAKIKIMGGD